MSAKPVGSLRGLMINSVAYDVVSDADAKIAAPGEVTGVKTTGGSLNSIELKCQEVSGVEVDCSDPATYDSLRQIMLSMTQVPISFEWAGGQTYSTPAGNISVGELSAKTGKCEIKLIPVSDWIVA